MERLCADWNWRGIYWRQGLSSGLRPGLRSVTDSGAYVTEIRP